MKRHRHLATIRDRTSRIEVPIYQRPSSRGGPLAICRAAIFLALFPNLACRYSSENQGKSNVNVVNGDALTRQDKGLARGVFHLNILDQTLTSVEKSCTAAAISEHVVLVAAHCLPTGENASARIKVEGKNASVKQIIGADSLYERTILSEQDARMDLAAVVLESTGPVFSRQEMAAIAPTSATPGSLVKMIGFGATALEALKNPGKSDATGQAAIGTQKILSADGLTYEFRATLGDLTNPKSGVSIAAPGDSGAPLFNTDGQLIGLLVGLSYFHGGQPLDLTQNLTQIETLADAADSYGNKAVDVRSPTAQKIIQIALGHAAGTISYETTTDQPTPFLAICRRNRGNRDNGDERANSERFGGRDLADLLERFRGSGRNGNGGNSSGSNRNGFGGGSSGDRNGSGNNSSSKSKLSDGDIQNILNDL